MHGKPTRSVKLILQFEQTFKNLQAAHDLSRSDLTLDDAWRVIDEYRQQLIYGLTPDEDRALEMARAMG